MSDEAKQVGGTHYAAEVQHWDYADGVNAGYLESAATKYITRWRKKNGLEDLRKAATYVAKRIQQYQHQQGPLRGVHKREAMFKRFVADNHIPHREAQIIDLIFHWKRLDSLFEAHARLNEIIKNFNPGETPAKAEDEEEEEGGPTRAYVNQDQGTVK